MATMSAPSPTFDLKQALMDPGVSDVFAHMIEVALSKRAPDTPTLAEIKTAMREEFTVKFKALEDRVEALESALTKSQASETTLTKQHDDLAKQLASTQQRSIMAQSGKASNFILSGVAETPDEAPAEIIKKLATDLNIKLGSYTAKRVGKPRPNKSRTILVSCDNYWDKRKMYAARTTLRNNGYENTYINEDLPPRQGEIYYHARQAKKQELIKSTWTDHGVVYIKLCSEEQAV